MTAAARPSGTLKKMLLPLARKLALKRVRRKARKVERLGRRMGLLQLGASFDLFQNVPGLADVATGGLGAKNSLATMTQVLESDSNVNWGRMADVLDEIDQFLKDANAALDHYDSGRPAKDKLFIVRKDLKGLF